MSEIERDQLLSELNRPKRPPQEQLSLFDAFVENTPAQYSNVFEFFDHVPKFALTAQTSFRKGKNLDIIKFEFEWGDIPCEVSISPVVLESRDPASGETVRKEILPGPREETIYRVFKKMAADSETVRFAIEKGVVLRFTIHHLRMRLRAVGHEYKVAEIRESLQVLNRSALNITDLRRRKLLYGGSYLEIKYTSSESDESGEQSFVEVRFNDLAEASITAQLYDRIHYERLMSLRPLSAWVYELLTRNFRQAGAESGYTLSLSRILRESGLPPRKDLRANLRVVRESLQELQKKGVLSLYPATREDVQMSTGAGRGRRSIKEVVWTLYPHPDVVRDIRMDNSDKLRRRQRISASPR